MEGPEPQQEGKGTQAVSNLVFKIFYFIIVGFFFVFCFLLFFVFFALF